MRYLGARPATLVACSHLQLLKICLQVHVILSGGLFSPCYLDYGTVWGMAVPDKEKQVCADLNYGKQP